MWIWVQPQNMLQSKSQRRSYLTERQCCYGGGDAIALCNGQHCSQQDEQGPNEVQPQTQPLVSSLQRPVRPATTHPCLLNLDSNNHNTNTDGTL